jgi:hypothetical protein
MARKLKAEEQFRREMSAAYKAQVHDPGGYDDWGMFTAHVSQTYRKKIGRLHALLTQYDRAAGEWEDPVDPR